MRPLTNDERQKMRHALGLDQGSTVYRNRYVSHGRNEAWEGLCAIGAAGREAFGESERWAYWVTHAGYEAVREPSDKLDGDTTFNYAN